MVRIILAIFISLIAIQGLYGIDFNAGASYDYFDRSIRLKLSTYYNTDVAVSELYFPNVSRNIRLDIGFSEDPFFISYSSRVKTYSRKFAGYDRDYLGSMLYYDCHFNIGFQDNSRFLRAGFSFGDWKVYSSFEVLRLNVTMTDLVSYVRRGFITPPRHIRGLNQTYNIKGNNLLLGIYRQHRIKGNFYLFGNFEYTPKYSFEALGYWNLRELHFKQKFKNMNRYDLEFGLKYDYKIFSIFLNYYAGSLSGRGENVGWADYGSKHFTDDRFPIDFNYKYNGLRFLLKLCM